MRAGKHMVFALEGQLESSPAASALALSAADNRKVLKGRLLG